MRGSARPGTHGPVEVRGSAHGGGGGGFGSLTASESKNRAPESAARGLWLIYWRAFVGAAPELAAPTNRFVGAVPELAAHTNIF